jgi:hypothetical protein
VSQARRQGPFDSLRQAWPAADQRTVDPKRIRGAREWRPYDLAAGKPNGVPSKLQELSIARAVALCLYGRPVVEVVPVQLNRELLPGDDMHKREIRAVRSDLDLLMKHDAAPVDGDAFLEGLEVEVLAKQHRAQEAPFDLGLAPIQTSTEVLESPPRHALPPPRKRAVCNHPNRV